MKGLNLAQNKTVNRIVAKINRILKIIKIDIFVGIISKEPKIVPHDIDKEFLPIYEKIKDISKTSIERMYALYKATEYIVRNNIEGDIVECGVWKGGSMILCALTLLKLNETNRRIYLYDTYEGMSEPTDYDIRARDNFKAIVKYEDLKKENKKWAYAPLNEVKKNLYSTNYPKENLIFVKGKVEDTIPNKEIPKKISLLRLDTDWYESTYHELKYLYPRLSVNGILLIDDYGHWKGARKAIDKYFKANKINILLNRIDNTGRLVIKLK